MNSIDAVWGVGAAGRDAAATAAATPVVSPVRALLVVAFAKVDILQQRACGKVEEALLEGSDLATPPLLDD